MATTQYIGARYVPLFAEPIEWDRNKQYEPLTIVCHNGNSYTSRQFVPTGIEITNEAFWALTGNYNAQVEKYRKEVAAYDGRITAAQTDATNALSLAKTNESDIAANDAELAGTADSGLKKMIESESSRATNSEDSLRASVNELSNEIQYHVGAEYNYKTINSALTACLSADKNGSIIIHPGTYNEIIKAPITDKKVSFIGVSKESCIWTSDVYGYNNSNFTGTGNFTFKNLTFIKNGTGTGEGGYAIHLDTPNRTGNMLISNCHVVSYENAAIGCGTKANQSIVVDGCLIESYAPKSDTSSYNRGAFLWHSSSEAGNANQRFELLNNIIVMHGNQTNSLVLRNVLGNDQPISIKVINNQISSEFFDTDRTDSAWYSMVVFENSATSKITKTATSFFGNSHNNINYGFEATTGQMTKLGNGFGYIINTLSSIGDITNSFIRHSNDSKLAGIVVSPNDEARSMIMAKTDTNDLLLSSFDGTANRSGRMRIIDKVGSVNVTSGSFYVVQYGPSVVINAYDVTNENNKIQLPEGFEPFAPLYVPMYVRSTESDTYETKMTYISTTGVITLDANMKTSFYVTYPIKHS